MSYAVTDAVEDDFRAEYKALDKINEDVDQLASDAKDCDIVAPLVKRCLDLAWYFAEAAMREQRSGSCGHTSLSPRDGRTPAGWCSCCAHFAELRPAAEGIRGRL
jgi:hypothetical protein